MVIASHFKAISEGHTLITSVRRAFYSTDVFSEVFSDKNALLVSQAVIGAVSKFADTISGFYGLRHPQCKFLRILSVSYRFSEPKVVRATYAGDVSYMPRSKIADSNPSIIVCFRHSRNIYDRYLWPQKSSANHGTIFGNLPIVHGSWIPETCKQYRTDGSGNDWDVFVTGVRLHREVACLAYHLRRSFQCLLQPWRRARAVCKL